MEKLTHIGMVLNIDKLSVREHILSQTDVFSTLSSRYLHKYLGESTFTNIVFWEH